MPVIASAGDACGDMEDYFAGGVGIVRCCVPCRLVLLQPAQKALVRLQVHLKAQRLVQGGVHTVCTSCLFGLVHFTVESLAQCDEVRICLSLYLPASQSSDAMLSSSLHVGADMW